RLVGYLRMCAWISTREVSDSIAVGRWSLTVFLRPAGDEACQPQLGRHFPRGAQRLLALVAARRDLLLEQQDAIDQRFGARRASRDIHIHGDDLIDALHDGIVIEDAAARR